MESGVVGLVSEIVSLIAFLAKFIPSEAVGLVELSFSLTYVVFAAIIGRVPVSTN